MLLPVAHEQAAVSAELEAKGFVVGGAIDAALQLHAPTSASQT